MNYQKNPVLMAGFFLCIGLFFKLARLAFLYGGARHIAEGAVNAAISLVRLEHFPTSLAVIKKLTGIGRHGFRFPMPAMGARYGRGKLGHFAFFGAAG